MSETKILLGFEVGTGKPIYLNLHHLVVTGMTQLSGKTTTIEALIYRSQRKAIAFITKRGEVGFQKYHEIPPYFKERSDWQYVSSLLEATLRERMKFERSWIIKSCRGAKSLKDVFKNIEEAKKKVRKNSLAESVYTNLAEYLKLVIPQIDQFKFSDRIELDEGINVMDLSEMSLEMRNLVIRSVMEYALDKLSDTIIIIPEAWEYLPQHRSTPVKYYADAFIRKGASVGNYLWVDSQDIAGIDKTPLRQCDNWILGRQKDVREVRRTREEIFKNTPTEQEIMMLRRGHFYACLGNEVNLVYVQPSWLSEEEARNVALQKISVDQVYEKFVKSRKEDDDEMWKKQFEEERGKREELEETVKVLRQQNEEMRKANLDKYHNELEEMKRTLEWTQKSLEQAQKELLELGAMKNLRDAIIAILPHTEEIARPEALSTTLDLEHEEMNVEVTHRERQVKLSTNIQQGQIMYVALHDLPKEGFTVKDMAEALQEHGWNISISSLAPTMSSTLTKQGLLKRIPKTRPQKYRLPTKVKITVQEN